jgi:hypothetical protein
MHKFLAMNANAVISSNDITATPDRRWNMGKKYIDICCSQCVVLGVIGFALSVLVKPVSRRGDAGHLAEACGYTAGSWVKAGNEQRRVISRRSLCTGIG